MIEIRYNHFSDFIAETKQDSHQATMYASSPFYTNQEYGQRGGYTVYTSLVVINFGSKVIHRYGWEGSSENAKSVFDALRLELSKNFIVIEASVVTDVVEGE